MDTTKMKIQLTISSIIFFLTLLPTSAFAHCQIPCGIFDDNAKIKELFQHAETIEKSSLKIRELKRKNDATSKNQLIRWTLNKEEHADKIIHEASYYFLAQRLKVPSKPDSKTSKDNTEADLYIKSLKAYHSLIISAMKTKQDPSQETSTNLKNSIDAVSKIFNKKLP